MSRLRVECDVVFFKLPREDVQPWAGDLSIYSIHLGFRDFGGVEVTQVLSLSLSSPSDTWFI